MTKCICDICGKDSGMEKFIVPFVVDYWAMKGDVKLVKFEKYETQEINLCADCYKKVAITLKTMQESHMKEEILSGT